MTPDREERIREAISEVQPVVREFVHPSLTFEIGWTPRHDASKVFVDHPEYGHRRKITITENDDIEHIIDQLYFLVNLWGDLTRLDCEHDEGHLMYRNRVKVCPICWREGQ